MLFTFSSCDALLGALNNLDNQENNNTEQQDDENEPADTGDEEGKGNEGETETKIPTTLADFAGTSFVYSEDPDWLFNYYMYVKDGKTIVSCIKVNSTGEYGVSEDKVEEDGYFFSNAFTKTLKIKVIAGRLFTYSSNMGDEGDSFANEKQDERAGVYGTWKYSEYFEDPNAVYTEITETTIKIGEEPAKTYTLKDGLFICGEGNNEQIVAYYDGTDLFTIGMLKLVEITDEAKAKEIKKAILGDEYVDDEGGSGEETKVPTSLADFVGTSFVYREDPDWYYNYYMYVKDADTIVTCSKTNETGEYWISEDKVQEDGSFWSDVLTWSFKIKVVAGKLILYRSNVYYKEDLYADVKKDETEGLYGTWEFEDAAAERPYPKTYVITKETFSYDECGYEDYDEENATTKSYTFDDGLLISDGEVFAYYDGTSLYTIGVLELKKVAEETLAEEIKKHAIDPDKDDDEGGSGEGGENQGGENEGENTIPKTFEDCIGTYHYWKDYYYEKTEYYAYIKDKKTIILYNIADKSVKESINCGSGFDGFMPWDIGIDVRPNGELVCYRTMFDHAIKTDDKEGLYGNWIDQTEQGHEFVIDENTVNGVKYVNKSNFLDFEDNSYSYDLYYDGEYLWTEGAGEFKRVDEKDLSAEIKKAIKRRARGEPKTIEDLVGSYFENKNCDGCFYLKDTSTVVFYDSEAKNASSKELENGMFTNDAFTYVFIGGKCIVYNNKIKIASKRGSVLDVYEGTWYAPFCEDETCNYEIVFASADEVIIKKIDADKEETTSNRYGFTYKDGIFTLQNGDIMYLDLEAEKIYMDAYIVNLVEPEEIDSNILSAINAKAGI